MRRMMDTRGLFAYPLDPARTCAGGDRNRWRKQLNPSLG